MSIRLRVNDALFLWKNDRSEGAFLSALIAVAATARKRYPELTDRDAFEQFLVDAHTVRISIEYRGEVHPVEHIIYKWLRCELVHEGAVPVDIEFIPDEGPGLSLRAGGAPEYVLKLSHGWFHHLVNAAVTAPENRELFQST